MLILLVSVFLLAISHGQCAIEATANLQKDGTTTSIGTLTFVQQDANSSVKITGTLNSLTAGSSHVCFLLFFFFIRKIFYFSFFVFKRVFMFMKNQFQNLHQIVQQL